MQGKIALEEHFAIEETLDSAGFPPPAWEVLKERLLDIHDERLRMMDAHGVEVMLLSLNAPAVQGVPEPKAAIDLARRANDYLAEQVAKRPDRFQGFAAVPLQDVDAAIAELERCIKDLGFKGVMVNGFSQINDPNIPVYLDLPQFRPFWAAVERLDVPLYLHPRNPLMQDARIYEGHFWLLGPTWAFAQETAVHSLRLMGSGLFDDHPGLKVIIGHMGEGIPAMLWRVDNRNAWVKLPPRYPAKRRIADYFRENFWITTSGNFRTQSLIDAILELGAERILFSVDWPYEMVEDGSTWFDSCSISEADRQRIGRDTARALFKLG